MQGVQREPRPAPRRGAAGVQRAEHRHRAVRSSRLTSPHDRLANHSASVSDRSRPAPSTAVTVTVLAQRAARAARTRRASPARARPMTIAAVLAMFASTQVAAATLAVRQHGAATSPVRGSTMWCTVRPPRRQRRRTVPEVARPPAVRVTVRVGLRGASWSSPTPICQPSAGGSPGDRDVTAEAHEHAATCDVGRPRRDPVGGQRLRRGAEVEPDAARRTQRPLLGVPLAAATSRAPDRRALRAGRRRGPGRSRGRSPARERPRRPSGRRAPLVSSAARSATDTASASSAPTWTAAPRAACTAGDLRVGAEPAARRVDRGQLLDQDRPRGRQTRRVGREERDRGPPYGPLDPARRAAGHDAPEVVRPGPVARRGGWTGGCRAFGADDGTGRA